MFIYKNSFRMSITIPFLFASSVISFFSIENTEAESYCFNFRAGNQEFVCPAAPSNISPLLATKNKGSAENQYVMKPVKDAGHGAGENSDYEGASTTKDYHNIEEYEYCCYDYLLFTPYCCSLFTSTINKLIFTLVSVKITVLLLYCCRCRRSGKGVDGRRRRRGRRHDDAHPNNIITIKIDSK